MAASRRLEVGLTERATRGRLLQLEAREERKAHPDTADDT